MAVVLALLMVASMPAMAVAGGGFGGVATQEDASVTDAGVERTVDEETTAKIADGLRNASGPEVDVIVRFDEADVAGTASTDATVSQLQTHAQTTQTTFLAWAKATESVTFKNDFWIANAVLVTVDVEQAEADGIDPFKAMAGQPNVDRLHENFELTAMGEAGNSSGLDAAAVEGDQANQTTYGLDMINATEVWDQHGTQGEGATVAVLDTGIDADHPDLDLYTEDPDDPTYPGGYMAFDGDGNKLPDAEPSDSSGHGTHTSGTVSATDDPAGVDKAFGVAPDVTLLHGQVIPGGSGTFAQVAAGMEWAVADTDADVISMSLGATGYYSEMVEPSENARDAGVILVASAGNSGSGSSGAPGNVYPNVAIGAVNANGDVAGFSSGETVTTASAYPDAPAYWPDEYVVPNVAAPGVDVLSSVPGGGYDDTYSGTSMSAPHVAGAFALMISASGGDADREQLIDAMETTAWKPDDWDEPDDEYDTRYGMGIIDVKAATDLVALDSGINGTVSDADGVAIEDATLTVDEIDFETTTDANGTYTVLAQPGNYTVTASGFGYKSDSQAVTIPDNETFVQQDFTLADGVGAELLDGQPEGIEGGEVFDVTFDVANLENYSVQRTAGYDGNLSFSLDGTPIDEGETVDVGDVTGEVTLTVTSEPDTAGDLSLEHTFEGSGDVETITSGPTSVFEEFVAIAVVDDGTYGDDVVDRLSSKLPPSYDISLIGGADAVEAAANDEYEGYVVQDIHESHVEEFATYTDGPSEGVVWLDQWGSYSDAIPARSSALDDPDTTDQSFTSPNPSFEIVADHPIFEGVGDIGDTVTIHDATFADHTWFDGYDGEVVGHIQAGGVTDGEGLGVDEEDRTVLLSTFGSSAYVDSGDYSSEADAVLANAAAWAAVQPPVDTRTDQPVHATPGDGFGATFSVDQLKRVSVSLADESTANQSNLDLYVDGSINAWGEWRAYDPPRSSDNFTIEVVSTNETVGSVVLETTFVFEDANVTLTTGPTAVYERPLDVPEDVGTIQEAVDLAPDGAEIVVANGTYEETVSIDDTANLTITAAEGATPTILTPDGTTGDVVSVDTNGTAIAGLNVDAASTTGIAVTATDVTITGLDVTNADVGVSVEGATTVDVSDVGVRNATTGIAVGGGASTTVTAVETADVDTGIRLEDTGSVDVTNATVTNATTGIVSTNSVGGTISGNDVANVSSGIVVDGRTVGELADNTVSGAENGVVVKGGADVGALANNEIDDTRAGIVISGSSTSVDATTNVVAAETGIVATDVSTDAISIGFNDLEATETAIDQSGDGPLDARHNWFGDRGPAANNGVSGDVVYDPFLTEVPDGVDENTTAIATDLQLRAGETYTVGVPGTTDQTIGDVFGDLEGSVYGYDSNDGVWIDLRRNDELSSLSAVLVVPDENGTAVLDFQDDGHTVPGSESLHQGWNLVSPTGYTNATDGFGQTHSPDNVFQAYEHANDDLGSSAEGVDEYDGTAEVNPFGGYWVHVESADDEYEFGVNLHTNPTADDLYADLGLTDAEGPGGGPGLPDEISVAVVDETDYHEGAIESALADELGAGYTVDTLTADELLASMDDYDVFVVQRFGSDTLAADFLDALGPDQATVYLDSYQGATSEAYADGVYRLQNVESDPANREAEATATDDEPVTIDIHEDHPIFEGVGGAGDTVEVYTGSITWGAWFDDYSGTVLADGDWSSGESGVHEGPAIAVNEADNEILNTAIARDYFTDEQEFTVAGNRLLVNSVEYGAALAFDVQMAEANETASGTVETADSTVPSVSIAG